MKPWIALAGLNGFIAVAMGAVGAHAVDSPALAALVERASLYQLIHAAALLALSTQTRRLARLVGFSWLLGIILFCGSLYAKALLGWTSGAAPAGGILLMLGWLALLAGSLRKS